MTTLIALMMLAASWAEPISALSAQRELPPLPMTHNTAVCVDAAQLLTACGEKYQPAAAVAAAAADEDVMMETHRGTEPMRRMMMLLLLLLWDKTSRVPFFFSFFYPCQRSATPAVDDYLDGLWRESGGRDYWAEVSWELDQRNRVDMAYKHGRRNPRLGPEL